MCGPCLKMPEEFSVFLEPIVPLTIAVAVGFKARILWYLFRYHRNRVATTKQQFSTKELRDMQSAMVGVTLQALSLYKQNAFQLQC
uniref:Endoplasmic reticulum transmembrane protein n=1 Tax=Panagrellus redivivus TaxID=6233 RepID=A0A7E4ZQS2_PANRE